MSGAVLIEGVIKKRAADYADGLDDGEVFEVFSAETLLKGYGLSHDEIEHGIVDGQNDGGIDACYVFVNRSLLYEDTDLSFFKSPVEIDVHIFQSKDAKGFVEKAVDALSTSLQALFNFDVGHDALLTFLNPAVVESFLQYRETLKGLAGEFPKVSVNIHYCTLATSQNPKVLAKSQVLCDSLTPFLPGEGTTAFTCYGANELYEAAQKQNRAVMNLPTISAPISGGSGMLALVTLPKFASFVSEGGELMERLFEYNIRDYQGAVEVNRDIAETLGTHEDTIDFWHLNNGVTIVADKASYDHTGLTLENPLIVNGLQTSNEIFNNIDPANEKEDRNVLVRVLEIPEGVERDRVIKATNFQTRISASSLHATEPLQKKIEDYLSASQIYYDRRKNYHRNRGVKADKIISIDKLAQSVMAILSERPHDARARPTTLIKDPDEYAMLFSDGYDPAIYKVCASLFLAVDGFFRKHRDKYDPVYRNNLRFHLMMILSWQLVGTRPVPAPALAKLDPSTCTGEVLHKCMDWLVGEFNTAGPEDKTGKDTAFTATLQANWVGPLE